MSDPLDAAVRALRARSPMDDREIDAKSETRTRLLRSVAHRARIERVQVAVAIAFALVATNSTTWAWSTGRLPSAIDSVAAMLESAIPAHPPSEAPAMDEAPVVITEAEPSLSPPLQVEEHAHTPREAALTEPAPRPRQRRTESNATEALERGLDTPPAIDTRDRQAFQAAHALHFSGAPPELGLRAWDTYLAEFPEGRFVPEASWNRVICLMRLERREEARVLLERFARGDYGGTRRRDAEQVIETMNQRE